jgi:hypothetical protein
VQQHQQDHQDAGHHQGDLQGQLHGQHLTGRRSTASDRRRRRYDGLSKVSVSSV